MDEHAEYILLGVLMRRLVSAAETGGTFCLFENISESGARTPVHVHADDDETLYVLEGEMRAIVDGVDRRVGVGEAVYLPRAVPHQLINDGGRPSRYLLLCTPSLFEDFLADAGRLRQPGERPAPPTAGEVERVRAVAPRHGITILPGW